MQRTLIANLPAHLGQPVKIQGWLQNLRDLSGTVQGVFEKKNDLPPEPKGDIDPAGQRQAQFKNGVYYDILMMSILRQEWNPPA
jgi:hypothetical protein